LTSASAPGDISHDGTRIAFLRLGDDGNELVVAARDDLSAVRAVASVPASYDANIRWSPDDRLIAFLSEPVDFANNLMVVEASGGTPRRIAQDLLFEGFTWVADGSGVIASSALGSTMAYPPTQNLWVFPLDGGAPSQLTFGESSYRQPDADTRGNLVVSRMRTQSDVWKLPVTGAPMENADRGTRITRQTGVVQTLTVSPDETEVAVLSDNGGHANVWIARIADGEMRPLTTEFDARVVIGVPSWAPRGDLINVLSNRSTPGSDVVNLWLARADGSDLRDLGVVGAWTCWSGDGAWLYYSVREGGVHHIRKIPIGGGAPVTVRTDGAIGCAVAADGSAFYYMKVLTRATGTSDFEIRVATPEDGPSRVIGQVLGSRIPVDAFNIQAYLSPNGEWLTMPLVDGATTNLWAISTASGEWRKLVDFGTRNVIIARRIGWSRDGRSVYAAVGEIDADIVLLTGLR
jgi:Tol biopolymer transport system component